jgi:hypothetical protein
MMTMGQGLASLFDVPAAERLARLRSLRLAVRLLCGPSARDLEMAIGAAETGNADALLEVLNLLRRLPALSRRRVLASWGGTLKLDTDNDG